jgi:hypothetical protein
MLESREDDRGSGTGSLDPLLAIPAGVPKTTQPDDHKVAKACVSRFAEIGTNTPIATAGFFEEQNPAQ